MTKTLISAVFALCSLSSLHAQQPSITIGALAPATQATRAIRIEPQTRYVTVRQGETVRFLANGQEFGFRFDGADRGRSFDLRQVAPAGSLDHEVFVYVHADPDNFEP